MKRRNFIYNSFLVSIGMGGRIPFYFSHNYESSNSWLSKALLELAKRLGGEVIIATIADLLKERFIDPLFQSKFEDDRIKNKIVKYNYYNTPNEFLYFSENDDCLCIGLSNRPKKLNKGLYYPPEIFLLSTQISSLKIFEKLRLPELEILYKAAITLQNKINDPSILRKLILPYDDISHPKYYIDNNGFSGSITYESKYGSIALSYFGDRNCNEIGVFEFVKRKQFSSPVDFFEEEFVLEWCNL